jgi:hypothetical protein
MNDDCFSFEAAEMFFEYALASTMISLMCIGLLTLIGWF